MEPTTEETVKRETTQSASLPSPVATTTSPKIFREANTTRSPNFWESTPSKKSQISNNATDRDVDGEGGHGHRHDTVLATCPKFHLEEGDYSLSADGDTASIPAYNVTLNATEFEVIGGQLVICIAGVARVSKEDVLGENKFSDAMGYVTLGGLGLSVVCLLLHIVATILVGNSMLLRLWDPREEVYLCTPSLPRSHLISNTKRNRRFDSGCVKMLQNKSP